MIKALELTGQKFSKLTVENQSSIKSLSGHIRWNCICDCGNRTTVIGSDLINGKIKSCGCYNKEKDKTHGMSNTPEYDAWRSIIRRCIDPDTTNYDNYGGRGITVCDRWLNSFEAFYEDMGSRPSSDHSIDRRENDLGYYKENCRWATRQEQANNRRTNIFYSYKDSRLTIAELSRLPEAKANKINVGTLYNRIVKNGYSVEEALNKPVSLVYTHNGVTKTIMEWAREYGIEYRKLYDRLIRMKWDFERAVNTA